MWFEGVVLNKVIYMSILNVCLILKVLLVGEVIYIYICEDGFLLDVKLGNVFISMFVRCGNL